MIDPQVVKMVNRLWLYPPILIAVSIPLVFISVYPVYGHQVVDAGIVLHIQQNALSRRSEITKRVIGRNDSE
jgi:hypothetical protein